MLIDDERIQDRYAHPRHKGLACASDGAASGDNPFCGDALEVRVSVASDGGRAVVSEATFDGYACSLCVASADLLMEHLVGMPVDEALRLTAADVLGWWGGLEVGRTRRGCVELPVRLADRALASVLADPQAQAEESHPSTGLLQ